jgi:seryl-tRNA synthetase
MLDYKFIKDNLDAVKENIKNRNMTADADIVVKLYDERTAMVTELQALQQKRNENAQSMKQKLDNDKRQELIAAGKAIKDEIATLEAKLKETEEKLEEAARQIPNMVHPKAPIGKLDTENLEVKVSGTLRKFDFEPKDHVQIAETLDILDFDRGTKVSGPKFYYLKNEAVFLEQALIMYALNTLRKHGFEMFITPDVAKEEVLKGIGFNPRGNESNVYTIEEEGTCLVATAEITLGGYHSDEILDKAKLPLLYGGLSHCFRREAGSAGQFSKGLYRVHQFDKVEMFAYATPEQSDEIHEKLRQVVLRKKPEIKEIVREPTAGGIVFRMTSDNRDIEILLIQDSKNRWTIPKGHIEPGETAKQTAVREIGEESGLKNVEVLAWLGKIHFKYRRLEKLVLMTTQVYLVQSIDKNERPTKEKWMNGIRWFSFADALDAIEYADIEKLMLIAKKKIRSGDL